MMIHAVVDNSPCKAVAGAFGERPPEGQLRESDSRTQGKIGPDGVQGFKKLLRRGIVERFGVHISLLAAQQDLVDVFALLTNPISAAAIGEVRSNVEDSVTGGRESRHQMLRALKTKIPVDDREA